ncbi:MAG TPA: hypothetical protein VGG74_09185 [Kofleriaceae bacterium]|jgi:hypothetical protein
MSRLIVVVVIAACAPSTTQVTPVEPIAHRGTMIPMAQHVWTCTEAALGLEHGSVDVRAPETTVLDVMRTHCADDAWSAAAIECFATMRPGDLARCAAQLSEGASDHLMASFVPGDDRADLPIGDGEAARTVADAQSSLASLQVNIAECDRFIDSVRGVLACESIPIGKRAELGLEASDMWSLPTQGLPADIVQRMANTCTAQLAELEKMYTCTP